MRFLFLLLVLSCNTLLAVNPPTLSFPANNATDMRVKLRFYWSVTAQTTYQYQYDTTNTFDSERLAGGFTTGSSSGDLPSLKFNTKYYWRVRAIQATDTSVWSTTRNFTTIDVFEIMLPFNNTMNINPTFNMNFKKTGAMVRLQYDTSADFSSPLMRDSLIADTLFGNSTHPLNVTTVVRNLHFGMRYYFRAWMYTATDSTALSVPVSYTIKTGPVISSPSNNAVNMPVNLRATCAFLSDLSNDASYTYQFQVDTTLSFSSAALLEHFEIAGQAQQPVLMYYNTGYFARVRAINPHDTSVWSTIHAFRTSKGPTMLEPYIWPPDTFLGTDSVVFRTDGFASVRGYEYKFDTTDQFNSPVLIQDSMKRYLNIYGRITVKKLFFNKRHFLAVRSYTDLDTSEWMVYGYSTVKSLKLYQPGNFSTYQLTSPLLQWYSQSNIEGYMVQLDTTPEFNSPALVEADSNNNFDITQIVPPDLRYDQWYYWRVKAWTDHDTSLWSEPWTFRTSPFAVYINNPLDNETNVSTSPTNFNWDKPHGARGYHYQLSTDSLFTAPINRYVNDGAKTNDTYNGLAYSTKYFLRLRCFNYADTADWYYLRRFTTQDEPPTPLAPILQSPANNATKQVYTSLPLQWVPTANTTSYEIEVDVTNTFPVPVKGTSTTYTINVTNLNPSEKYYWRVRAVNGPKKGPWSTVFSFTTLPLLVFPSDLVPDNFQVMGPEGTVLRWTPVPDVESYQFQYANDPFFSGQQTYTTTEPQVTLPTLTRGLTYYWRVRSVIQPYISGWSFNAIFRVAAVGLKEEALEPGRIYPNPFGDELVIDAGSSEIKKIEITDMSGRLVLETVPVMENNTCRVNTEQLSPGFYLIRLINDNQVLYSKIIK